MSNDGPANKRQTVLRQGEPLEKYRTFPGPGTFLPFYLGPAPPGAQIDGGLSRYNTPSHAETIN